MGLKKVPHKVNDPREYLSKVPILLGFGT